MLSQPRQLWHQHPAVVPPIQLFQLWIHHNQSLRLRCRVSASFHCFCYHCIYILNQIRPHHRNVNIVSQWLIYYCSNCCYCTLDAVTNATTNENYPFDDQISSYINVNMFFFPECHRSYYDLKNNCNLFNTFVTLI